MADTKYFNQAQPQMLQGAVLLLYFHAVFGLLGVLRGDVTSFVLLVGAAAAWGMANEKKWGWMLGVGVAVIGLLRTVAFYEGFSLILNGIFDVLLLILLFHSQTAAYRKIWFK